MAVTLRDVAAHAGVSFRTVSNVVNGYAHVSPGMREKVQASLDELGYRPNLLARSLRQGRTGILALLVPEITVPYFAELAHEVVEQASALGCTVMVDETAGDPARERALLETARRSSWVDGVLLSSLGLPLEDLASLGETTPVVLLGERVPGTPVDHVGVDNVAAAAAAVEHLLERGCRRVATVGGRADPQDATTRQRLDGARRALGAAGRLDDHRHVGTPDYHRASGAEAVAELVAHGAPDGVFCFSDDLAVGLLRGLHDAGLRVPDDVAVIGFDDAEICRFTVPSLSTVRPEKAEIARAALDLPLRRVGGGADEPQDVRVGTSLVARESTREGTRS